jgi:hypothetical protein
VRTHTAEPLTKGRPTLFIDSDARKPTRPGSNSDSNRYIGAVSLGFSPAGTRIRKKVVGRTKTEVRDKVKELHKQVESGLRRYSRVAALRDQVLTGQS